MIECLAVGVPPVMALQAATAKGGYVGLRERCVDLLMAATTRAQIEFVDTTLVAIYAGNKEGRWSWSYAPAKSTPTACWRSVRYQAESGQQSVLCARYGSRLYRSAAYRLAAASREAYEGSATVVPRPYGTSSSGSPLSPSSTAEHGRHHIGRIG